MAGVSGVVGQGLQKVLDRTQAPSPALVAGTGRTDMVKVGAGNQRIADMPAGRGIQTILWPQNCVGRVLHVPHT